MIKATMTMADGATIDTYFDDGSEVDFESFTATEGITNLILSDVPDLEDACSCRIGLRCGNFLFCLLPADMIPQLARMSDEIVWCAADNTKAKVNHIEVEEKLNARMGAAYSLIINHPDSALQYRMIDEYLKRKAAYVASIEAFIQGMTNEQSS